MSVPNLPEQIAKLLRSSPLSGRELCDKLKISQPTLSRHISTMGDDVVRIGAARSLRYALRRSIRQQVSFVIYLITSNAQLDYWGDLIPVHPHGYVMSYKLSSQQGAVYSEGLPWWLQGMRPQGFLGRAFAKAVARWLELSESVLEWDDDDVLWALSQTSQSNLIGNIIVGDPARKHWGLETNMSVWQTIQAISATSIESGYQQRAQRALAGDIQGSSAGGEQPKFVALIEGTTGESKHVIVKFSAPADNEITQRWRNLLACEHIALETLNQHVRNIHSHTHSRILDCQQQRFLEVSRFDCVGTIGRQGVVSLAALQDEFIGTLAEKNWSIIAQALFNQKIITEPSLHNIYRLHAFGFLIGNSDMHNGNLSFKWTDENFPLTLAPVYDMLPMSLAPQSSGVIPQQMPEPGHLPEGVPSGIWKEMLPLAQDYWKRVQASPLVDEPFKSLLQATATDRLNKIAQAIESPLN